MTGTLAYFPDPVNALKKPVFDAIITVMKIKDGGILGRTAEIILQCCILVSIIASSIETLPGLRGSTKTFLNILENIFICLFTLEYITRICLAKYKRKYIFGFYGIIDFLSILPFYISFGFLDARSIKILRILRFVRLLKLTAYNRSGERFAKVIKIVKGGPLPFWHNLLRSCLPLVGGDLPF